jgi:hypothetical protein
MLGNKIARDNYRSMGMLIIARNNLAHLASLISEK